MVHISLADLVLVQAVDPLGLGQGSQGTYVADLRLSSREHGGPVNPGNNVNLSRQPADLVDLTSVRALSVL